jgi:hypothetical protein
MASRLAGGQVVLAGKTIDPGDSVILHLGGANRDEAKFENANTFDVLRHPTVIFPLAGVPIFALVHRWPGGRPPRFWRRSCLNCPYEAEVPRARVAHG